MLETEELFASTMKRPQLAPKAIIHQRFGSKACYRIEEVSHPAENSFPGLALTQNGRSLYKCYLDLPELSVVSEPLSKKKDAEHAAAKIAIEKLGIQSAIDGPTPQEAMDELSVRLAGFFTDKFLSSMHPLVRHIKVALERAGDQFGMLPMSAISTCDAKVNNLCKAINSKADSDPFLVLSLISRAARMSASVTCEELWIWKKGFHPTEFLNSTNNCVSVSTEITHTEALLIPCLRSRDVENLTLNFSDNQYYMDEIAQKLHVRDSSRILVSRNIGKASSEMRLYFSAPDVSALASDSSIEVFPAVDGNINTETILNERASHLSGQHIYGDAILAHVGYTWKSSDLFYEDVSLSTYYRMILGKLPDGHYKLSREAILGAELPAVYSTRSNWKGPSPRDLLYAFCRQHRLSEPHFSIKTLDYRDMSESYEIAQNSNLSTHADEVENFVVEAPSRGLIFSAAGKSAKHLAQLSLQNYFLEYSVKLLQVTEPLEDRIEQALFSPPLSKQRVEFAVGCINELHATSLVDFGCGSGSLLESLLDHTTTLENVAGVDISRKGLLRAAKILHLKLSANHLRKNNIRSIVLYDGSITEYDSRLGQFDIGTCLEVIEHMEEDQACLFGDVALSFFRPAVLVVSTPNYEYNPILRRSSNPNKEDSEDNAASTKFRNHDHKFEWTRLQFQHWANDLAAQHHYSVEFSGVGGSIDVEPGFASQIAVFKRGSDQLGNQFSEAKESSQPYEVVWQRSYGSAMI